MNLESQLNNLLSLLLQREDTLPLSPKELIPCLDLTLLSKQATNEQFFQIKQKAQAHPIAAVCVPLPHLRLFSEVHAVTVINFPGGEEDIHLSIHSIKEARQKGAQEIDYVFPYSLYLEGKTEQAFDNCQRVIDACHQEKLILKVILETGVLVQMNLIYDISLRLASLNCHFLKTSTGTVQQGASFAAVFAMLSAIKDSQQTCGIKISGGIREVKQALAYARLAQLMTQRKINAKWFRIGASDLLDKLLNSI